MQRGRAVYILLIGGSRSLRIALEQPRKLENYRRGDRQLWEVDTNNRRACVVLFYG